MSWRGKFVFLLIVYFAGFATAIYFLVPAPEGASAKTGAKGLAVKSIKTDELAKSFNAGMHKCVDIGKDVACRAAEYIKERIDEHQPKKEG